MPDHSTIWRFRNTLTKQGLLDTLLAEASIVDATVIEAKQSRPRKGKDGEAGYNVKKTST